LPELRSDSSRERGVVHVLPGPAEDIACPPKRAARAMAQKGAAGPAPFRIEDIHDAETEQQSLIESHRADHSTSGCLCPPGRYTGYSSNWCARDGASRSWRLEAVFGGKSALPPGPVVGNSAKWR